MVPPSTPPRLVLRPAPAAAVDGLFWPRTRQLSTEIDLLLQEWPAEGGHVSRILYSPPDWDDRPRQVEAAGRVVKTGCFPRDDTRVLTVVTSDRRRLLIGVLAPDTGHDEAVAALAAAGRHPATDGPPPGP